MNNKLLLGIAASLISFASFSHANIAMRTTNGCDGIAGKWAGNGQVFNVIIGSCRYHGSGEVTNLDSNGRFTLSASIDKDYGVCPDHGEVRLPGTCSNGNVTITTDYGNLHGDVHGKMAVAKGRVEVSPGITADVSMQIHKVG